MPRDFDDVEGRKGFKAVFREHRQLSRFSPSLATKCNGSPPVLSGQRVAALSRPRSYTLPLDHPQECLLETSTELISSTMSRQSVLSSCSSGSNLPSRHSSNLDFKLFDMPLRQVSKPGRMRRKRREEETLVGRHRQASHAGDSTHTDSFDTVVAFVARRVYRRVRQGTRLQSTPPLLSLFDEVHFSANGMHQQIPMESQSRCCCLLFWRRQETTIPTVTAREIFDFLFRFTTWCAMPADLIVVALVYLDMLVEREQAGRVLTVQSWRPLLVGCLLLASKVYEDWCICNFEAAQFTGFTDASMLRLELLIMDTLNWNANISAETFAPYFWAVEKVIAEGKDDMNSSFAEPLTAAEREQLQESLGLSALQLISPILNKSSPSMVAPSSSCSLCSDPDGDSPRSINSS